MMSAQERSDKASAASHTPGLVSTKRVETPSGIRYLFYCMLSHQHDSRVEAANCSRNHNNTQALNGLSQ